MLNMAADPPVTLIGALSVLPGLTQALAPDLLTQTGAILTTAGATQAAPIETETARSSATIHGIMNSVLNIVTMLKAGVINDLVPGVMTGSHVTLIRIIVLHAMPARVILSGIIALHAAPAVLTGPLTKPNGPVHKILAGRVVPQPSAAILFRINSISTSGLQKMNNLKGITNVLMAHGIKDARRLNLPGEGKLQIEHSPRQKYGTSPACLMGAFLKDRARHNVEMNSSGRK